MGLVKHQLKRIYQMLKYIKKEPLKAFLSCSESSAAVGTCAGTARVDIVTSAFFSLFLSVCKKIKVQKWLCLSLLLL